MSKGAVLISGAAGGLSVIAIKISMTAVTLFGFFLSIYATPSSMLYRRRLAQKTAIYG